MHGPRDRTKSSFARVSFLQAAATLVTVVASFLTVYALCRWCGAQPGPAILAAILAMTLSRRAHPLRWSRPLTEPLAMACTALAATGAAWLLHAIPLLGAVVFVAVMFLSVWLRNFGERERTIGTALARTHRAARSSISHSSCARASSPSRTRRRTRDSRAASASRRLPRSGRRRSVRA
jgi:hypothetical protein